MVDRARRRVLKTATTLGAVAVAGCVGSGTPLSGSPTETPTPHPDPGGDWDWEWSGECAQTPTDIIVQERSTIEVERAWSTLEHVDPIRFSALTTEEREILETVIETGGYGTCDISDAFGQFLERVRTHKDGNSTDLVFLERDGVYYQLGIIKQDQVIAG
jgi:hypothetical protein